MASRLKQSVFAASEEILSCALFSLLWRGRGAEFLAPLGDALRARCQIPPRIDIKFCAQRFAQQIGHWDARAESGMGQARQEQSRLTRRQRRQALDRQL